jgi:hypothetical protein
MTPNWYTVVKDFAPVVAAVVALGGIVMTILWNARKARTLEEFKLDLQRKALCNALAAELRGITKGLNQAIEHLQFTEKMLVDIEAPPDTAGAIEFPTHAPSMVVYREAVKQIGILPANVVVKVVEAYSASENLASQVLFLFDESVPFSEPKAGTRTSVPYRSLDRAIQAHVEVRTALSNAILAVEAGNSPVVRRCDISR